MIDHDLRLLDGLGQAATVAMLVHDLVDDDVPEPQSGLPSLPELAAAAALRLLDVSPTTPAQTRLASDP